jgi:DNA (cytosine-5)-methyltransferase 1
MIKSSVVANNKIEGFKFYLKPDLHNGKIKFIDLFAGLGGIRLGFCNGMKDAGFETECVFSSEIKSYAIKAYKGYYGEEDIYGDITQIDSDDIPDFDFLLAGFPCQPFSSAGKGLGFADTRGTLFFEIERILKSKIEKNKPAQGFLLENVEGLVNHDGGNTLKVIINHLKILGYNVSYNLLDSQYFGLPQSRKRVYIVGMLKGKVALDNFPKKTAVLDAILDKGLPTVESNFTRQLFKNYTPQEVVGKSIKDKRGGCDNIHSWDIELKGETTKEQRELLNKMLKERRKKKWAQEIGIKWMDGMPLTENQIRTFYDVPDLHNMLVDLENKGYLTYEYPRESVNGIRVPDETKEKGYNIVAGKLSFQFSKILDPNELAPTLVAMDVSKLGVIDGKGLRRLTIRECQRLCGYPEDYDLSMIKESEAFDLLGNTVCVPVIEEISKRIGGVYGGVCYENDGTRSLR